MGDMNPVWKATKTFVTGSIAGSFATCCIWWDQVVSRQVVSDLLGGLFGAPFDYPRKGLGAEKRLSAVCRTGPHSSAPPYS